MNKKASRAGFSLIEVVMAIGIVAFSMLAILGLLPVALQAVSDSATKVSLANISQQIRTELVQTPFNSLTNEFSSTSYYYFNLEGVKMATSNNAYFQAGFSVDNPDIPGTGGTYPANAKKVKVTVLYPFSIGAAGFQTNIFTILAAKQKNSSY